MYESFFNPPFITILLEKNDFKKEYEKRLEGRGNNGFAEANPFLLIFQSFFFYGKHILLAIINFVIR